MRLKHLGWFAAVAVLAACDTPLDTDPTASIPDDGALTTANNVRAAIRGAYDSFDTDALYNRELTAYPDLYADNLSFTGTFATDQQVALRQISPTNGSIATPWAASYGGINRANNIIAAVAAGVDDLDADSAHQYEGEARFIRALHYFNLVRYFGGVPILTEPTRVVGEESKLPRNTAAEVYALIESDLAAAVTLLPSGRAPAYVDRQAAQALQSRVFLEEGKYAQSRDAATAAINATGGNSLPTPYAAIWEQENTQESLFELQYSINDSNSQAFWAFPTTLGGRRGYAPTAALFNAYSAGDVRRDRTIGLAGTTRYGRKFFRLAGDDNVPVLRRAELFLNRAEANARLGADVATVLADVNIVRARAGVAPLTAASVTGLVIPTVSGTPIFADTETNRLLWLITQERRLEFALEGYRFFDLRRTGVATVLLGIPAFRLLFPIPQSEIDVNPNLAQNPGY
jgi:hypothetical protein